jgi:glucosamine 6-phosphate synthetase-like amidotransferase/phosphosugar isomerase protein
MIDERRAITVMRDEIATIPDVIATQAVALRPVMRDLAERHGRDLAEVILTGCGDSHYAGIATRLAFLRAAGVRCRPLEALELARYEIGYVPSTPAPLVVAVSYGGEVGRTIEAATAARARHWPTVALTGRLEGRLAASAGEVVHMDVPTLGFSPGTSTYIAMVTALLVLAAELGRVRSHEREAAALDEALARAPDLARETLEHGDGPAREAATAIAAATVTTFLGAGPSRASALFGAAKLFEGPQRYGVAQDLEEWAHEQYFISGPSTPIVVIAPDGPSFGRACELLDEMRFIGATPFLVSDRDVPGDGLVRLPIAPGSDEAASPLLTALPLAQVGFHVADVLGAHAYGFPSAEHEREHYETIHRDARVDPA